MGIICPAKNRVIIGACGGIDRCVAKIRKAATVTLVCIYACGIGRAKTIFVDQSLAFLMIDLSIQRAIDCVATAVVAPAPAFLLAGLSFIFALQRVTILPTAWLVGHTNSVEAGQVIGAPAKVTVNRDVGRDTGRFVKYARTLYAGLREGTDIITSPVARVGVIITVRHAEPVIGVLRAAVFAIKVVGAIFVALAGKDAVVGIGDINKTGAENQRESSKKYTK